MVENRYSMIPFFVVGGKTHKINVCVFIITIPQNHDLFLSGRGCFYLRKLYTDHKKKCLFSDVENR